MIEAIIVMCSVLNPADCTDVNVGATAQSVTPYSCAMHGQTAASKWMETHPGWAPRRITCQRVGRYAKA
jgi:hypothetical protein